MANDLTLRTDSLPGLELVDEGERLLEAFTADIREEHGKPVLSRLPTKQQRRVLIEHRDKLATLIRPTAMADADKRRAASALALMFSGFLSLRKADASELVATFLAFLEELPVFAIEAACRDVPAGRITEYDKRSGKQVPIDAAFPPTSPQLYAQAAKHAEKHRAAHHYATKILAITVSSEVIDPVMRDRVGVKFKELASDLAQRSLQMEAEGAKERARAQEKRDKPHGGTVRRHEKMLEAEYAARNMAPVRVSEGIMISPALAAQIAERDLGGSRKVKRKGGRDE